MRMPWSKSNDPQLDLLEPAAVAEAASPQPTVTNSAAGRPLMLAPASLYEDPNNPRTEIPEPELDELAADI